MTQQQIYHLNEQGELEPMREEPFDLEDNLQELVAGHLELLSGERINPDNPRRFILVDREQGIADIIGGSNRWALDHLLIDQDAVPTLVEVKRSANSQIRREIVGQMMDYAAHATQTWNVSDIRRIFEKRVEAAGQDPDTVLAELLQSEEEPDADAFWQQVETNLRSARLRLLFVADGIPDELTRVVEFLNEQMPRIEVLAVEIKQFQGATGSTLVPRVIGRTAEAVAAPTRRSGSGQTFNHNEQTLIQSFADPQVQQAATRLLEVARKHGAVFNWASRSVTIRRRCAVWNSPLAVAWLFEPEAKGWGNQEGFHFGAGNFTQGFFESLPANLRQLLDDWIAEFSDDDFGNPAEVTGIITRAIPHQAAADNIDLLAERLDKVLTDLAALSAE